MNTDKGLTLEISAILILTVGRAVATDVGLMIWHESRPIRSFGYNQFSEIARGIYLTGFVIFIVLLKQLSFKEIGISPPKWGKDFIIGVFLVGVTAALWTPCVLLLNKFGPVSFLHIPEPVQSPSTFSQYLWFVVATVSTGFAEELLTRGYLLSRLRQVIAPWRSVVLSAGVFAVWHISQGVFGVAHTFIWGLVYGYTFNKIGRVWPLVVGHITNNLIFELVIS